MAIDHSSCDHPRTPAGRAACRAAHSRSGTAPVARAPRQAGRTRQRPFQGRGGGNGGQWVDVAPGDWLKLGTGRRVRIEHTAGFAWPEGMLIALLVPGGRATVDLGDDGEPGTWRGVRHVPTKAITRLQVWKR